MADHSSTFDFIENCGQLGTAADLVAAFQRLIANFGMSAFAVGEPGAPRTFKPDRIWADTWPDGWARLWAEENYVSADPVIYRLLMQNTPFRWSELRRGAVGRGAKIMDAAREFGLLDGLGIAIHSCGGGRAAVTMGGPEYALSRRDEASLHLASIYLHARIESLQRTCGPPPFPALTRRECDCLSWVATGKTDWEISQILSLSESTVKEYVQSAMRKLDSTHRAQAVARAIVAGAIDP